VEGSQASTICPSGKSDMKVSMEHWLKGIDRGKLKYWKKTLYSVGGR
jgi:hypothetical protein